MSTNQCVEEYSGEERSKILWTEIVKELFALPHDQPREEKLAVLAGMSTSGTLCMPPRGCGFVSDES